MKYFNKYLAVLVCHLFIFSACGGMLVPPPEDSNLEEETGDSGDSGDSGESRVASFGTNDQYLYLTDTGEEPNPALYPAVTNLMEMAAGFIKIFNPEHHFPIDWDDDENLPLLVYYDEIGQYKEENEHPDSYTCALPADPSSSDVLTTGGAGTNTLPERDESWAGSQGGGCGTWATAMCNRILGLTDAGTDVSKDEWNGIADGIGQNAGGGSKMSSQSQYYKDRGYSVNDKKFGGSEDDYAEMVEMIDDGCDVKIYVWKRNADGTYTNGHVETVTEANAAEGTATTNSWGNPGTIRGGDNGGFDHSLDGTQFQDDSGNELWPADATEVWVSYVCETGFFEGLAKKLLGY